MASSIAVLNFGPGEIVIASSAIAGTQYVDFSRSQGWLGCLVEGLFSFAPPGLDPSLCLTHGLRRGLQSCAPSELVSSSSALVFQQYFFPNGSYFFQQCWFLFPQYLLLPTVLSSDSTSFLLSGFSSALGRRRSPLLSGNGCGLWADECVRPYMRW